MSTRKSSQQTEVDAVVVEPFVVASLEPHINDPEIAKLLPKSGVHPIRASVIIHGINSAIANGLRRILHSEMENLALFINQDSFRTTDKFVMIDMITRRVLLIPLTQDQVELGMHFVLDVSNDTDEPMDVFSESLRFSHSDTSDAVAAGPRKKRAAASSAATAPPSGRGRAGATWHPFFETFNIMTLQPHREIHFVADVILGNGADDAVFSTAFTTISIPLDERPAEGNTSVVRGDTEGPTPIDLPYKNTACEVAPARPRPKGGAPGQSSQKGDVRTFGPNSPRIVASASVSDPHVYQIIFEMVGKGEPVEVFARAVDSFIARVRAILSAPYVLGQEKQSGGSSAQATPVGEDITDLYTIKMQGETRTIGELFARCCVAVFPHIDLVSCDLDDLTGELTIRVRSLSDPIANVIRETVDYALSKLSAIKSQL